MNICVACDYAALYEGNFIPSILEVSLLIKENNRVIFCFPEEAKNRKWIKKFLDCNFDVCYFSRNKKQTIKTLRKICRSYSADVLYTHFISQGISKLVSPFCKKLKLVIHIHSDFSCNKNLRLLTRMKNWFFDIILRRDAKYIFVSEDLFLKSNVKFKYYLPNCISSLRNRNTDTNLLNDLQIQTRNAKNIFLLFAWSPKVKGLDIAAQAFNHFRIKNKNSKLIVVVNKENGRDNCIKFLQSKNIQINEDFIFAEPIEEVFTYYKICTAFISASRSEGFSYSVLEALELNKPVIISKIIGTNWAKQFNNTFFYDTEDFLGLSSQMELVSRLKNSVDNSKRIQDIFPIEGWIKKIEDILYENKN